MFKTEWYLFRFVKKCIFYFVHRGIRFDSQEVVVVHSFPVVTKKQNENKAATEHMKADWTQHTKSTYVHSSGRAVAVHSCSTKDNSDIDAAEPPTAWWENKKAAQGGPAQGGQMLTSAMLQRRTVTDRAGGYLQLKYVIVYVAHWVYTCYWSS